MKVKPYGNALDFLVSSDSREGHHLVSLDDFEGNGSCQCEDFNFNRLPLYRLQGASDKSRCKHITEARAYLLDKMVIPRLSGMRPK